MLKAMLFVSLFINLKLDCKDMVLRYHSLVLEYHEICQNVDDNKAKYCKKVADKLIKLEEYLEVECEYKYMSSC
jgi:hypothetical protein